MCSRVFTEHGHERETCNDVEIHRFFFYTEPKLIFSKQTAVMTHETGYYL